MVKQKPRVYCHLGYWFCDGLGIHSIGSNPAEAFYHWQRRHIITKHVLDMRAAV